MKTQSRRPASRIIVLDESVANKIAAGEVVERPSSVVKELIENSIDAGAARIAVDIEVGGRRLIRVVDNGCGMTPQEAVLSLQRHATSKIRSAKDLFSISTLGFRGEALPSIASVSKLQLITRTKGAESATKIDVAGGEIKDVSEMGAPVGTEVSVAGLFFNTPARYKFMKSPSAESSRITAIVSKFSMGRHDIGFRLTSGGKRIIDSPGSQDPAATFSYLFGAENFKKMIPFELEHGQLKVRGYTSDQSLTRANRSGISTFVNRRLIHSPGILQAVAFAYREELPPGRFPLAVIFIEIDPKLVDVNVHPTKSEVKFADDRRVVGAVKSAIADALARSGALSRAAPPAKADVPLRRAAPSAPERQPKPEIPLPPPPPPEPARVRAADSKVADEPEAEIADRPAAAKPEMPDLGPPDAPKAQDAQESEPVPAAVAEPAAEVVETPGAVEALTRPASRTKVELRPLGQVHDAWIIAQSDDGLVIIDQHAAHERILYNKCLRESLRSATQRLLVPLTLDLGRVEAQAVSANLDILAWLGFETEEFGGDSFVVRSVPALVAERSYVEVLRDMVDELAHDTMSGERSGPLSPDAPLDSQRREIAARCACKMAIKSGDRLSHEEIGRLIADLGAAANNRTCPHGRPTMISFTKDFLAKKFKRK